MKSAQICLWAICQDGVNENTLQKQIISLDSSM